jgi:putative redox protein
MTLRSARRVHRPRQRRAMLRAFLHRSRAHRMAQVQIVSDGPRYRHQIRSGTHQLSADEPLALGGQGAGFAPFDLYLASLSACTAITLRMYAEKKGWDLGEFRAELASSRNDAGKLVVHRVLHASGALSDAQWARLLDVVERTPVTLVMREGAVITSERGTD